MLWIITMFFQVIGLAPFVMTCSSKGTVKWHFNWCLLAWCAFIRSSAIYGQLISVASTLFGNDRLGGVMFSSSLYFAVCCSFLVQVVFAMRSRKVMQLLSKVLKMKENNYSQSLSARSYANRGFIIFCVTYCLLIAFFAIINTKPDADIGVVVVDWFLILTQISSSLAFVSIFIIFVEVCNDVRKNLKHAHEKLNRENSSSTNKIVKTLSNIQAFGDDSASVSIDFK